jgi:MFS transporter, DHA3 family, macrolide efflux protein
VTQILSPALAGVLVAWAGPEICFYFDVGSFLFSAAMVMLLGVSGNHAVEGRSFGSFLHELTGGLRFIFTHQAVSFVMIAMTAGMFAVRCFGALLAVWVRDVLAAGPAAFGLLNSCVGIGMICATQSVHRFGAKRRKDHLVLFGLGVAAVFILLTAALPGMVSTALGMFGMGVGIAFVFLPSQTLLQQETPPGMMGRVSSGMMSALAITQVIALLLSGQVAQTAGIRTLYFASGAMLAAVAGLGVRQLAGSGSQSRSSS